jgi:hypothetical protein
MFQLTEYEHDILTSQIATSKKGKDGVRKMPYTLTEHGHLFPQVFFTASERSR